MVIGCGLAVVIQAVLPCLIAPVDAGENLDQAARETVEKRAVREFQARRFGMFIHWGPVSLRGTEIGWSRGAQVPIEEYDQLYKRFNPVSFDADAWARLATDTGVKYVVITSKHHDGFCLWDSQYTDYDIMATPFKRDILAELSDACRRHDLNFGVYYSLCDWHHPDYPRDSPGGRGRKPHPDMPRYFEYVKNQTREILQRYGPVGVLWFDGEWEQPWTSQYGNQLYRFLKEIQPDVVINNRVSKGRAGMQGTTRQSELNAGDFDTPEQRIGGFNRDRPWESCITIGRQWSWKPHDELKSLAECIQTLVRTVGGDGNLLLNVGPMPDGRIEPRQADRLREIGDWLKKYGDGVYGTRGGPFKPGGWGASTCRGHNIYLYVINWPDEGPLVLPPVSSNITQAMALGGGGVTVKQDDDAIRVSIPANERDPIATVIRLTLQDSALDIEPMDVPRLPSESLTFGRAVKASNVFLGMNQFAADKAVDDDADTRWATDEGVSKASLEVDLGEPRVVNRVYIDERQWNRVRRFELQVNQNGQWRTVLTGTTIGADYTATFKPVLTRRVRLRVLEATNGPTLYEFQLFGPATR